MIQLFKSALITYNYKKMKYNLEWILNKFETGENIKYIFFWSHKNDDNEITKSCLSQWYESTFFHEGFEYKSAEHWMMAQKAKLFDSNDIFIKIINCRSPGEAKKLGRIIPNFDNTIWDNKKYDIVIKGNLLKFSQNERLHEFLINTKDRVIAEASPLDKIWGIGLSHDHKNINNPYYWNGENLLGFALMEVRDTLNKIGKFEPLINFFKPPWIEFHGKEKSDMFWRMGEGENYNIQFRNFWNNLTEREKIIFRLQFPEPDLWKGFWGE